VWKVRRVVEVQGRLLGDRLIDSRGSTSSGWAAARILRHHFLLHCPVGGSDLQRPARCPPSRATSSLRRGPLCHTSGRGDLLQGFPAAPVSARLNTSTGSICSPRGGCRRETEYATSQVAGTRSCGTLQRHERTLSLRWRPTLGAWRQVFCLAPWQGGHQGFTWGRVSAFGQRGALAHPISASHQSLGATSWGWNWLT